jgi:hypothetical protein
VLVAHAWESEIVESRFKASLGKKVHETPISKIIIAKWTGVPALQGKAPYTNPSTTGKKKQKTIMKGIH